MPGCGPETGIGRTGRGVQQSGAAVTKNLKGKAVSRQGAKGAKRNKSLPKQALKRTFDSVFDFDVTLNDFEFLGVLGAFARNKALKILSP